MHIKVWQKYNSTCQNNWKACQSNFLLKEPYVQKQNKQNKICLSKNYFMFVLENNIECCFRAIEYSVYCDFWSLIFVNLWTTDRFSLWCIWSQWTIMIYIMTGANPPTYALHPQSTSCQQSSKSKYLFLKFQEICVVQLLSICNMQKQLI